jgi:hypothetical protein
MSSSLARISALLAVLPLLGGCTTALLLEKVRGRPPEAAGPDFSVEVKEAFLDEGGVLMLLGYRNTVLERETWVVRIKPSAGSMLAVPWQSWRRGAEPSEPVFLPRDGASDPAPEERAACSYAGRMRQTYRPIPVYEAEPQAAITGDALILPRERIRLAGRDARSAEVQAVVLWASNAGAPPGEVQRVELSFLEDLRPAQRKLGYLGLLPFSLSFDAAFLVAGIAVTPLALLTYANEGPSVEELAQGRAKGCGCLSREGNAEGYARWPCYEPF